MIIHTAPQNSEGWFLVKKGRPSASNFDKIITAAKGLLSSSCDAYINQLIAECFCPTFESFIGNKWTDRGLELEPEAREAFATHTGHTLKQVGFVTRDDQIVGCSPDSLIIRDETPVSGLEIKCPSPTVHVGYVRAGVLPDDYKQQVHGSMAVTGLNEWHFWSWYPGMRPFHVVVRRDDYTAKVKEALDDFLILYKQAREKAVPLLRVVSQEEQS